jgi:hypothetical protein
MLNPTTDTTRPATLIQSLALIVGSSVVNREKDKGRATLVLFLGDTTCGAERDLGALAVLLQLAISQTSISQTGDLPLRLSLIGGRHSHPACINRATAWPGWSGSSAAERSLPLNRAGTSPTPWLATGRRRAAQADLEQGRPPKHRTIHRPEPGSTTSCRSVRANNSRHESRSLYGHRQIRQGQLRMLLARTPARTTHRSK